MRTILITDSCCDLPYHYTKENNIIVLPLTVHLKDKEIKDELGKDNKYRAFYDLILSGEMPTTSQINAYTFKEEFEKHIKEGHNVIYIGFSSALSGCVNSAYLAVEELREEMEDVPVTVVDSKAASLGVGLLVYYANEFLKQGKSKDFVVAWLEENKLKVNHWFTVEDLNHLYRGGRVSKTAAAIGTILSIKPIMNVNDEGKLTPVFKAKGRKKSLNILLEQTKLNIVNPKEQIVFISHGGCEDEVAGLIASIKEELKVKDVMINPIGAAIGSHAGPGTVAIFCLGEKR
ncbi:DegV family protein [Cellulosilyticum sp. I15G10I2]|uniref:DegV family protein n=1 Tax=Cellulosilyticum sp. I15G10I2 TaxID=1892843 RepID=UPI00085CCD56|nr:DegV family protein [Cellulosilyticum sp. I15G10I2]